MPSLLPRKSKVVSAALWCSPSPNTTASHYKVRGRISLAQQLRQYRHLALPRDHGRIALPAPTGMVFAGHQTKPGVLL
jgi:hypothetical protein